jgi:hypothetical protein
VWKTLFGVSLRHLSNNVRVLQGQMALDKSYKSQNGLHVQGRYVSLGRAFGAKPVVQIAKSGRLDMAILVLCTEYAHELMITG